MLSTQFMVVTLALAMATSSAAAARAQELRRSGFVGVQVVAVPDEVRRERNVPTGGVLVKSLVDGGSARAAGVVPDDVIVEVAGHAVAGVDDFVNFARRLRAGDAPPMRIVRAGGRVDVTVPIRPRPTEHAADVDVTYGAVLVDGAPRRTITTKPRHQGRYPAILYANGIGCFSQESLDLSSNDTRLLYGLTRAGFVTMRVEKSGIGDSEGPACSSPAADFNAEVRAYAAGVEALKALPSVDADAVFLLGLSIGGVEAPLIAARSPVRGVVVVNTVAKPLFEYLLDTRRRQMLLAKMPYDEVDRRMAAYERCNHRLLVDKQRPEAIVAGDASCADAITYPAPFTFVQQWADVNVPAAWKAVDRPVLVLYGMSDYVSTIDDDPYLAAVINALHPGRATLKAIQGMDHGLSKAATMAESFARTGPGEFEPAVIDVIASWLRATLNS